MKRRFFLILVSLLILGLTWFLFIKTYDYQINFTVKTSPGVVYNRILDFKKWKAHKSDFNIKVYNKSPFKKVDQRVILQDSSYILHWDIKPLNDSITKVKVYLKDQKHSVKQRFLILLNQSGFIKNAQLRIELFAKAINKHSETFRTKIIGKSIRPGYQSLIYITFSTDLRHKANKMMRYIYFLTHYMSNHKVKQVGDPFMNITHWDIKKDSIVAEFCFPVENLKQYPSDSIVKIRKNTKPMPALKAIYNGNYIFSNDAWFALLNYAEIHHIEIKNKAFEIYYNDPHDDGNENKWQADVYLPLKNKIK